MFTVQREKETETEGDSDAEKTYKQLFSIEMNAKNVYTRQRRNTSPDASEWSLLKAVATH